MADAILTPFDFSEPVKAGRRRFWKQILPVTSIDYEGQKIDFDEAFHKDLLLSFTEGAYDQVPLVFANADNQHNMDPRNFGGELLDVQYRGPGKGQGTWGLIQADRTAERVIKKNPRLGVSARIVQGINKADGRSFKRAINHVLLTMNPRVSGMEPWQAVDLSDEDATNEVVDLTAATYNKEGSVMGVKRTKTTSAGTIDLSALSDEQFEQLLDLASAALVDEDLDEDLDEEEEEVVETKPSVKKKKSKTKITVEKESEDEGDEDEEEEEEEDEESTDLSDAEKVQRSADHATVRGMQIDLAEQKWASDRKGYLAEGVPPFLLDLAEPVLKQPEAITIDLSDGKKPLDASATIRKMLDGFKGLIDLTPEIGHQIDLADTSDSDDAFLKAWDEQYG